jgi:hypothetical protein
MEQQFSESAIAAPVKSKTGMLLTIIINVIISAIVSLVVSYSLIAALIGPLANKVTTLELLTGRVMTLEQQMAKQMSVYKVK